MKKSFQILHSFSLSFVLAFILEPKILSSYLIILPDLIIFKVLGWALFFLLIPIQIYIYAGIYGCLIELVTEGKKVVHRQAFDQNARLLWKSYVILFCLPYLIHFISFVLWNKTFSLEFYKTHLSYFIPIITAIIFIRQKYSSRINFIDIKINFKDFILFLGLAVFQFSTFYIPEFFNGTFQDSARISLFISIYIQFLTYIFTAQMIFKNYPELLNQHKRQKELILINPGGGGILTGLASLFNRNYPPVFLVLKALTPPDFKISEFNRVRWHKHYCEGGKLVAITCYTSNSAEAYKIAKDFKLQGSKVIMGGPHVTYLSDEALEYCDSVVIGEAEGIWPEVIKDYENHSLKKKYIGQPVEEYHKIVHQTLLQSPPEVIKDFLETTRGCKFRCHFCSIPGLSGGNIRNKPPLEVIELIQKIKHRYPSIVFLDNNIYSDPVYTKELFEALKPLKIKWSSLCTIDIAKNEKLLKLAKESGCELLAIGYEIRGDSVESSQRGKFAMAKSYLEYTKKIKEAGIKIRAGFIFGFDSDRYRNLFDIFLFAFRIQPTLNTLALLTPVPGTQLYQEMMAQNRLININWRHYAALDLVVKHKYLNPVLLSKIFFPFIPACFALFTSKLGYKILLTLAALSFLFVYLKNL